MKFTTLAIENFLTLGKANVRLDERGLVLIQGENRDDTSQDSNGAGKSSLADALSWVLYGVTARGESGDEVINNQVKRGGAKVTLDIDDDGTGYRIERTRLKGKGTLSVYRKDKTDLVPLTKGTMKLSQDLIDKIIGCSADVFANAIYSGQERTPDLPGMTDKMLKLLIEEAAGINRLERSYKVARERMNEVVKEIGVYQTGLDSAVRIVELRTTSVERLSLSKKEWDADYQTNVKALVDKIKLAQTAMLAARGEYDALSEEKPKIESGITEITDKLAGMSAYHSAVSDAERSVNVLHNEQRNQARDIKVTTGAIDRLKREREEVTDIVGTDCRSCGKPYIEDDIASRKGILSKELVELIKELKAQRTVYEGITEKLSVALSAVTKAKSAIPDTTSELTRRDALTAALNAIKTAEREATNSAQRVRELMLNLKALKAQVNPNDKLIEHEQQQLVKATVECNKATAHVERLEQDLSVKKAACQVFGPAGVRAHILDTVTPFLNDRTNHYLSTLTDGNIGAVWNTIDINAKGEIKEKFTIAVESKVGAKTFKGLSGGEKRKTRLACSMALQDLVSSRATKPIEIYVADEIDHALDEAGLERLMSILEEKATDRGTVLVISHNSLSDWCSNHVTVVKEGGVSHLEGRGLE